MALALTIAGSDKTSLWAVNTLQINSRLGTRNRASFSLVDPTGAYRPEVNAEVIISDGATRYFAGFVDSFTEELTLRGNQASLSYELEAVSYDALADRRLVAASYETPGQTLFDLVDDIVTQFMLGDGITTANVDTGPAIERIKFNYVSAAAVFDELSSITGYAWWIDESKNLYFKPRNAMAAPFNIDATNARNVSIQKTAELYRNKQLIRAGVDLTASRTENFTGDGTQKAWTLTYPVGAVPTSITVGGVGKTIGIRGVEVGFDFYWNLADPVISQDDGAAAVGAGVGIAVTYQGQFPILVSATADAETAAQAAVSGASGVFESIEQRPNVDDDDTAISIAQGLLRRYGKILRRLKFDTDTAGLMPGQILPATFGPHAVSGSWLVDQVSARDRFGKELTWSIEALDGESVGGWAAFFEALAGTGRVVEFRENEVIILLRLQVEPVTASDSLATPNRDESDPAQALDANLVVNAGVPESRADFAQADLSEAA
jgi:hypothetical protein